ncbi:response regulator transcription factor [Galbibacter sp. EGI 63066]|uniref:response regulator transcription factor n=1 Tax=Galbibacter sp. EGI 63066 TaxID=2993559 RepID=UPI0022487842|nr:response regulator transcription factor [Galbibacter sp. EGI 63066]MCX2679197.1 response regulator transcription factor [Galbibacter sp. EGI 63066]
MNTINIILADDHVLVRDGVKSLLENDKSIKVIDEASDGKEAVEVVAKSKPDILVVDIRMPEKNGIEVVKEIKKTTPEVKALVLSMHDSEEYVIQSIQAGADGYLLKGSSKEEFLKALHTIADGGKYFTGDISSIIINNFVDGKPAKPQKKEPINDFHLTKREKQILSHVLKGQSNKEIAEELKISKRTAEVHRFNLMKKLGVKNQIELANKARTHNLV